MKKKYPIVYLPPAERDLKELYTFILREAPSRAPVFLKKIDRSISRLSRFPLSGIISRDKFLKGKGYRIVVIQDYLVFYRFLKRKVWIHRILHGKRRYEFLF